MHAKVWVQCSVGSVTAEAGAAAEAEVFAVEKAVERAVARAVVESVGALFCAEGSVVAGIVVFVFVEVSAGVDRRRFSGEGGRKVAVGERGGDW